MTREFCETMSVSATYRRGLGRDRELFGREGRLHARQDPTRDLHSPRLHRRTHKDILFVDRLEEAQFPAVHVPEVL